TRTAATSVRTETTSSRRRTAATPRSVPIRRVMSSTPRIPAPVPIRDTPSAIIRIRTIAPLLLHPIDGALYSWRFRRPVVLPGRRGPRPGPLPELHPQWQPVHLESVQLADRTLGIGGVLELDEAETARDLRDGVDHATDGNDRAETGEEMVQVGF